MMRPTVVDSQTPPRAPRTDNRRDDLAYIAPMGAFLLFTWAGGNWPQFYPISYVLKTLAAAGLLVIFWRRYTPVRWSHAWLGVFVGVLGIVQWVGMQKLLWKVPM